MVSSAVAEILGGLFQARFERLYSLMSLSARTRDVFACFAGLAQHSGVDDFAVQSGVAAVLARASVVAKWNDPVGLSSQVSCVQEIILGGK